MQCMHAFDMYLEELVLKSEGKMAVLDLHHHRAMLILWQFSTIFILPFLGKYGEHLYCEQNLHTSFSTKEQTHLKKIRQSGPMCGTPLH